MAFTVQPDSFRFEHEFRSGVAAARLITVRAKTAARPTFARGRPQRGRERRRGISIAVTRRLRPGQGAGELT